VVRGVSLAGLAKTGEERGDRGDAPEDSLSGSTRGMLKVRNGKEPCLFEKVKAGEERGITSTRPVSKVKGSFQDVAKPLYAT
jgi:hypothetical protein